MSIVLAGVPVYTTRNLSLLLRDLVPAGVVLPRTELEMAKPVVGTNAGADKGLKILGCGRVVVDGIWL